MLLIPKLSREVAGSIQVQDGFMHLENDMVSIHQIVQHKILFKIQNYICLIIP